jgi:hypothetical protein
VGLVLAGVVVAGVVVAGVVVAGVVVAGVVVAGVVVTGVVVTGLVLAGVVVAGLVRTWLVAGDGSVRAGADVTGEPNESGWRPFDIESAAVLGSGAGGSAAATGTSATAQIKASEALQRHLASFRPPRSERAQMLTLSPRALRFAARRLDAGTSLSTSFPRSE